MMERQRLSEILEACGANPARWPEAERAAAEALLVLDGELQAQAGREQALDACLADWGAPAPRQQAVAALLEASRVTVQTPQDVKAQMVLRTPGPARRRERWLANGGAVGLAASIVALLMVVSKPAPKAPVEVPDSSVISLAFSAELSEGWM